LNRRKTGTGKSSVSSQDVGIFSTPTGIKAVQSPARAQILSVLSGTELHFDDIVQLSGKAKSTVSVHLQGLEREGLVNERVDPEDTRKKIFALSSHQIGNLSSGKPTLSDNPHVIDQMMADPDPFRFYRLMFRTIRVSLISEGINIDPVLQNAGLELGKRVYTSLESTDLQSILGSTERFWTKNKLGALEIESTDPLVIRVYDCFECGSLPQLGRPACAFDSGILEAIFSRYFQKQQHVSETACFAMGNDYCRFVISP